MKKLIIYGIGASAEVSYASFMKDSEYKVVGFTIEQSFFNNSQLFGLPVFPFENIEQVFAPEETDMFIAVGPIKLGTVLEQFCKKAKLKGYKLVNYRPPTINYFEPSYGENCFLDHGSRFSAFIKVGNGVLISHSDIGHHVEIGNYSFITNAIVGAKTVIEDQVFIGMGSVIREGIKIGKGSIIGMGCIITKDVAPYSVYSTPGAKAREGVDSRDIELFRTT